MSAYKLQLPIVEVDFSCFNCNRVFKTTGKLILYCSRKCEQEAAFVRYFRSCKRDGRLNQPDVQEAFQIRIAHILGGGYNSKLRRLPLSIRQNVYERDNGFCQICGKNGTDIDHIKGNSSDLENLQVLCRNCHNEKTKANFRKLTPEVEGDKEKIIEVDNLRLRTELEIPERISDDEEKWKSLWRGFMSERRKILHDQRFLQYARNYAKKEGIDVPNL